MTKLKRRAVRRRALKLLGFCLGAALLGLGGSAVVSSLRDSSPALQRPDLVIAFGVGVVVWLGGASSEDDAALRGPQAEDALSDA